MKTTISNLRRIIREGILWHYKDDPDDPNQKTERFKLEGTGSIVEITYSGQQISIQERDIDELIFALQNMQRLK